MRSPRRFHPAFDCLQVRIAPSGAVAPSTGTSGVTVVAKDDTGSPLGAPSGNGSHPIIMTPPANGSSTPTPTAVC